MKAITKFKKIVCKKSLQFIKTDIKDVPMVNPSEVFKTYKVLDRGNSKLANNILSFSLPPVMTCGRHCKGCYDVASLRYTSVKAKRLLNLSMALHNPADLETSMIKQIKNSRSCEYVRIHVGGDFYSDDYVAMWERIVKQVNVLKPSIKFYTYTKTKYTPQLNAIGINVVKSIQDGGELNFGSLEYVNKLAKKYDGIVCPVTVSEQVDHFCGSKCTACMNCSNVFFKLH